MKTGRRALLTLPLDANVVSALAAVIALVVFANDALTPLDIAIAVFYTVVQLIASTGNRASPVQAAWDCVVLTLFGFPAVIRRGLLELLAGTLRGEPAGDRHHLDDCLEKSSRHDDLAGAGRTAQSRARCDRRVT
jgi:hypothetical protein